MNQGSSNTAACRIVGVNRRTGTRWRYGRTVVTTSGKVHVYRPADEGVKPDQGPARYLSQDERFAIADGLRSNDSMTDIASSIGRSISTVSREVKRNSDPITGRYLPSQANRQAAQRRARPKQRKLAANVELRDHVQAGLEQRWSPEQVSERLIADFPDRTDMRVAPETIYQSLYNPDQTGLRRELAKKLRTGRMHRRRHRRTDERRVRFIDPMMLISKRPREIDHRTTVGHWEGDLIVGARNQSAIGTLVERLTRYTLLVHMEGRTNASDFAASLADTYAALPAWMRESLTWDQGVEMAGHAGFTKTTGMAVYFCDPRAPWQRGTNENTNGLLRQYFPKFTDLGIYTPADLRAVEHELNHRPRKVLGWQSPAEQISRLADTHRFATTT